MTHVYVCKDCCYQRMFVNCHPNPPVCEHPIQYEVKVQTPYGEGRRKISRICGGLLYSITAEVLNG